MSKSVADQSPKNVAEYDGPTKVSFQDATRFLWGDEEAQYVNDYIYGKNARIGCVVFTLRPRGFFKVSTTWKPYYNQHRFYYVVRGQLTIQDPESGDVVVAIPGDAIHWRGAKWHFGYNFSDEEVFVLDWYAPQERPQSVTEVEFAKTKPELAEAKAGRDDLLGRWPAAASTKRSDDLEKGSVVRLTIDDTLNFVHGKDNPLLERIFVSTDELTGGVVDLLPGQRGDSRSHAGEKVIFALRGKVNIYLPETFDWFELNPKDALYLPANTPHQFWNYSAEPSSLAFHIVPGYDLK